MTVSPSAAVLDTARPTTNPDAGHGREVPSFLTAPQQHQRTPAAEMVAIALALPQEGLSPESIRRRAQGTGWLLSYLARFPGPTWQQRWAASGLEQADPQAIKAIVCEALELVQDVMTGATARGRGLLRRDWVERRLTDPHAETTLGGSQLWQAALLEMWLQSMGAG